jgi:ABC-type sugar transport system ATPase subunit
LIRYGEINRKAALFAETTKIKFNNLESQPVDTLSGGNQQKVVLSKWLMTHPQLLILDEPTKGIDIGAKQEIYSLINNLVDQGASTIIISSEIEELLGMCDRILVMSGGKITSEVTRVNFDKNAILEKALHKLTIKNN